MKKQIVILSIFLIVQFSELFATAQYGDRLVIDKDTFWINSNPLESYFDIKGNRTINDEEIQGGCTALWRGYVATWLLQNDSLFLIRIQTDYCGDNPIDLDIKKEFGSNKVFAEWVNHTIVQTKGELIQYVHMGYMSIYEQEIFYRLENGVLKNTEIKKYVKYNDKRILPVKSILSDTINKLILKEITIKDREQFSDDNTCFIDIIFNSKGEIKKIVLGYNQHVQNKMEEIILSRAKKALTNFPKIMRVKHERYYPPTLHLFFNGYCLKHPKDREYGCNVE